MKARSFPLIFLLFTCASFAQSQTKYSDTIQHIQLSENSIYELFPTQNMWTFIKLDTRNGKMWQVHFSIENLPSESVLNSISLLGEVKEVNGRFTLHPTENIYNFLLLDQIDGYVYQVQWSMDAENRIVIPIK